MAIDPNKFTRKTGEAVQSAQALARERNQSQVTPEHLLAALVSQPESVVLPVLERLGVAPKTLLDRVDEAIERLDGKQVLHQGLQGLSPLSRR
jgi:ATP-dependent Clp protease ATP-binding subunit ClpB